MKTYRCGDLTSEDIKRIINKEILEKLEEIARNVYKEEKKKEEEEIVNQIIQKEGNKWKLIQ